MPADENTKLHSAGGPLFRRPDVSHEEFATAWHRHGQLCTPWCLNAGVWEYIQIHMPSPSPSPAPSTEESKAAPTSDTSADAIERKARRILQLADGVAIMRFQVHDASAPAPAPAPALAEAKAGKLYFEKVVLVDERRFLHDESGAGAVRGEPPVYDVPELHVDVWREMALGMGGVEYVKIRDGKDVAGGAMWEEWEKVEGGKKERA